MHEKCPYCSKILDRTETFGDRGTMTMCKYSCECGFSVTDEYGDVTEEQVREVVGGVAVNDDINCPYCGASQEICHDDGYGYEEDSKHEQECGYCDRNFVYQTSISYFYEAEKADCLNGADHSYEPTTTFPVRYTRMMCVGCDKERRCTEQELQRVMDSK
jgi:hypothetical protein